MARTTSEQAPSIHGGGREVGGFKGEEIVGIIAVVAMNQ